MTSGRDPDDKGPLAYDLANGLGDEDDLTAGRATFEPDDHADEDFTVDRDEVPLSVRDVEREIGELSKLPDLEYHRVRKPTAKRLDMGVRVLDREVEAAQRTRSAQAAKADRHRKALDKESDETQWPFGFSMRSDGLYREQTRNSPELWLCAPIEVLGNGRDSSGHSWFKWLRWKDGDRRLHTYPMPMRLLTSVQGELEGELADGGLRFLIDPQGRAWLRQALNEVRSHKCVTLATQPGWHAPGGGSAAFMLPDGETCGVAAESLVLKSPIEDQASVSGTLADWTNDVASHVNGNALPMFMLAAAFAGPLIDPLGETSGGFHFHGKSNAGKTLAMKVAVSVWGPTGKSGRLKDWRGTANAFEGAAEECSDGLLALDEIHQADPRHVVPVIYDLANESGKQRLTRQATKQRKRTWRCMILSNGEVSIPVMAAKAGQTNLPAGAEIRLPSIEIDAASMWSDLGKFETSGDLFAQLFKGMRVNYGTPIRAFLERLTEVRSHSPSDLEAVARDCLEQIMQRVPHDADGQIRDVARRCALVATAGELAIKWGILPWDKDAATEAAIKVFDMWKDKRGGVQSVEEGEHVRVIRALLSSDGGSRFVSLNDPVTPLQGKGDEVHTLRYPERAVIKRAGYRRASQDKKTPGHDEEYLILKDAWNETCNVAGVSPFEVARTLRDLGFLIEGEGNNLAKKHRIAGSDTLRLYTVKSTILADVEAPKADDPSAAVPTVPTADD